MESVEPSEGAAGKDIEVKVTVKKNATIKRNGSIIFFAGPVSEKLSVSQEGSSDITYATLKSIREQATAKTEEGGVLGDNLLVEVVVTSDATLANYSLPESMVTVQDASGAVQLDYDKKNTYKIGDKLVIDLSGMKYTYYRELLQIDADATKTTVVESNASVEAKEISVAELLTGEYQSQYVAIKGVQAAEASVGKMLGSTAERTTINIEDIEGRTFVISHSKTTATSPLNELAMPEGSGTLKGIASVYGNTIQVFLSKTTDVDGLTGERFVKEEPTPTGDYLFISEYLEGSSNNKYIELYNPNDFEVDLGDYYLLLYANGNFDATNSSVKLEGKIGAQKTVVYKHEQAKIYTGDAIVNSAINFNGDDVVVLNFGSTKVDVFGPWDNAKDNHFAKDKTYRRKAGAKASATWTETEWEEVGKDNVSGLGKYPDPVE